MVSEGGRPPVLPLASTHAHPPEASFAGLPRTARPSLLHATPLLKWPWPFSVLVARPLQGGKGGGAHCPPARVGAPAPQPLPRTNLPSIHRPALQPFCNAKTWTPQKIPRPTLHARQPPSPCSRRLARHGPPPRRGRIAAPRWPPKPPGIYKLWC
ncbi:MAG: hypothetical protein J3K34DRAFT_447436 [Monoraphidium minutum]|nr:MAG: hypothetical protein J3K34DRAFT_447436 [Monoraphidium minutum]